MKNSKRVFLVVILMLILAMGNQSVLAKGADDSSSSNSSGSSGKSDQSGSNSGRNGSDDSSDDSIDDNSGDETDSDRQEDRQEDRQQDRQRDDDDAVITPAITPSPSPSDDSLDDSDDIKSEVKSSPKENKTNVTSNGIKTTIINKDGRFIVKTEEENSAKTEADNNELMKIDERLESKGIKVSALDKDEFVIRGQDIAAITNFPLSLDFETAQLIVTTSAGQKIITVLPDKAIENIIAANIINRLGKTQKIESIDQVIKLGEDNGLPIYEINGLSDQKLLGIIPISIKKSLVVSAQTGEVVSQNNSLLEDLLDLLSV